MSRLLFRQFALALVALIGVLGLTAPALDAAAEVEIAPTETVAEFRFEARGFEGDEEVSTWLTGPHGEVMATDNYRTNGRGRVEFTMKMPRHFEPGRWAITVHGLDSNREAVGYFEVPAQGPNVPLVAEPSSGPAGTTFSFAGSGFRDGEIVSYWLTGPDGAVYQGGAATARADGTVTFSYAVGSGTQPGEWRMSASGNTTDNLGVAVFTVT
jgi:hypothetical protein